MASTAFLARADARSRSPVILVVLEIRAKGSYPARTLRLASRTHVDQLGYPYDACVLDNLNLDFGGGFMENGWQPGDCTLSLVDRRLSHQDAGEHLSRLLWEHDMVGTPVTVYQSFTDLPLWSDVLPVFVGEVADVPAAKVGQVNLHLVQSRKWVRPVPDHTIERSSYEDAPQESVGKCVPIIYGNLSAGRYYLLVGSPGNIRSWYAGVSRAPLALLPIGSQVSQTPRWLVASHDQYSGVLEDLLIEDPASKILAGTTYVSSAGLDAYGNADLKLTGTNYSKFDIAILPPEPHADNDCADWLEAVRPDKDIRLTGYAQLDYDAGLSILKLQFPADIASKGAFQSATARVWYAKNSSTGTHPKMGLSKTGGANDEVSFDAAASSTYPSDTPLDYKSLSLTRITKWEDFLGSILFCEVYGAGQEVQVHRLCITVNYIPDVTIIQPGKQIGDKGGYTVTGRKNRDYQARSRYYGTKAMMSADVTAFDAGAYTYQLGYQDDSSGTYTGTPSSLIEHPADIVHHALRTYGSATASEITTAASTFGSFSDIRDTLGGYKAHCHISTPSDVASMIEEMSSQFLIWFFRRGTDSNAAWVAVPWDVGSSTDYRSSSDIFTFGKHDIVKGSLQVKSTAISKVRNVVRVNYDFDLRLNSYAQQVFITASDSRGWTGYEEERDQDQTYPNNREELSADSVTLYGLHELIHNMPWCNDPQTATSVRNRLFDLLYRPRVTVTFSTFMNAADLERGNIIELDEEWDNIIPYPSPGSDGSWGGKGLRVVRTSRRDSDPSIYEIEAVEVRTAGSDADLFPEGGDPAVTSPTWYSASLRFPGEV